MILHLYFVCLEIIFDNFGQFVCWFVLIDEKGDTENFPYECPAFILSNYHTPKSRWEKILYQAILLRRPRITLVPLTLKSRTAQCHLTTYLLTFFQE